MNDNGKDKTPPIIREMKTMGIEIIVKDIIGTKELVFLVAKTNAAPPSSKENKVQKAEL